MLKDFLCVVEGGDLPSPALLQSLSLTQGYRVSPFYVAAVPGPPPLANIFGVNLVESLISKAKEQAADTADKVGAQIIELSRQKGAEPQVSKDTRSLDEVAKSLEIAARSHDLTLLSRPESTLDSSSTIFEAVLFGSGRPVLLAPALNRYPERFEIALLAWDGSIHASRAIASAIALFPGLREIFILSVVGEKDLDNLVPGADIAAHIRRHGIETTVACVDKGDSVGSAILTFAARHKADLLIAGAYGHSRLREFILGGVTDHLSRESNLPLFLTH